MTVNSPTAMNFPTGGEPPPPLAQSTEPGSEPQEPEPDAVYLEDAAPSEEAASEGAPSNEEPSGDSEAPPGPPETVATEVPEPPSNKRWYVVKVQSGREKSIKEAIERRVKIEGLEEFFG